MRDMKAAVFDLDGTLIDTEPRNQVMWARLFEVNGAPYDRALISSFAGRRGGEVLADLLHLFPGRTVGDLFAEAVSYGNDPDLPVAEPVKGAVELVTELHRLRVPLAVVTSGIRPYAEGLLALLGIGAMLQVVVTANDVTDGKPHPEGYLAACRGLGVHAAEAVAFEDAPAGVAAAKAAGMRCVGVTTTQPAELLAGADLVVADLTELSWPPQF
ncbi:MAG: haloacid dehalogenase [Actinomycetia bacterium]|nr:haloacid dehalogenase [Actinomycetes bacterium]